MIQKAIHRLLISRHFWRHATFSEVAELYASRMLRMLALNMASSFTSIYLYQHGYSVLFIAVFWAIFFFMKALLSLPGAAIVARIGPKHSMLIGNLLFIPAMICLSLVPTYGLGALIGVVSFQALSAIIFQIGYAVDFSKVKSVKHAGKEIAYMNILEKITTGLSPLLGGVLALLVGPEIVILFAALLFTMAALPLFKTAEVVLPHQKLNFRDIPKNIVKPNLPANIAYGFDVFTSGTAWSLFTAITIIGISSSNEVYAANGALSSVVLLAALAASYAYGKLIDKRKGKSLIQLASVANAITHFLRPTVGSPIAIAGLNIANEAATTGYLMAYTRGNFDNADLSGQRVTYLGILEAVTNFGAALAAGSLALLVLLTSEVRGLEYFFYLASLVVLLIATARFSLYRK